MSTQASHVVPRASLLGLPLELREQIYFYYFKTDGGYISDGDKLVQASGQAASMSLRLACRLIACETRHFPFTLNTITFSTIYRPDWRKQASTLKHMAHYHLELLRGMVLRLRRLLTPDMYEDPSSEYSQYMPIVREEVEEFIDRESQLPHIYVDARIIAEAREYRYGEGFRVGVPNMRLRLDDNTVSLKRTRTYLLRQLAEKHPTEFSQAIEEILPGWNDSHSIAEFFGLGFDPWAMPTRSEVKSMVDLMQMTKYWERADAWYELGFDIPGYTGPKYRYKRKSWFSAAAQAIRFLGQLSHQQRLLISKLILKEDRYAAAFPESHIIGMIPYCRENPKLHVEHRINLWRNVLAKGDEIRIQGVMFDVEGPRQVYDDTPELPQIMPRTIGSTFTGFIMHTLEALKEGLPSESYSFILGGYPDRNRATELFSISLKPYVAWLTAHTDCVAYGVIAPSNHSDYPFTSRSSAEGVTPVSERASIIQCDFTLDQPWDYETIYDESAAAEVSTLERLMLYGPHEEIGPEIVDVSTRLLDWEKIQRENYEMEELSEGVFAESYNRRHRT
ncbi:hypothetical protein BFJ70_g17473 [Fusarium oxysporum]|nr:hypothetical protein BFJ70_g17473 [Fusarium oxysporum]